MRLLDRARIAAAGTLVIGSTIVPVLVVLGVTFALVAAPIVLLARAPYATTDLDSPPIVAAGTR